MYYSRVLAKVLTRMVSSQDNSLEILRKLLFVTKLIVKTTFLQIYKPYAFNNENLLLNNKTMISSF